MTEKTVWGSYSGEDVLLYTISCGKYKLSVMTKGATIVYYGTDSYNAVLTHDQFEGFLEAGNGHRGEVVGPVANRINNATFTVDGVKYNLDRNFHSLHTLHSGSANWGDRNWIVKEADDDSVTFSLSTPDGDGGFPGNHTAEVKYTLSSDGALTLEYRVSSDKKCPVFVTNHAYFVLDDRDTRSLTVCIPSDHYIEVDSTDLIPLLDNPTPVKGTDYDFNTPILLGSRRNGEYDNTWMLKSGETIVAEGNRARLECDTTEVGVQMYTGKNLPSPFGGIALETGFPPDSPNRPDFPIAWTDKDKVYESKTVYRLKMK